MSDVTRTVGLRVEIETAPANAADKVKEKVSEIGKEAEKTSTKTKKASSEMAAGLKGLQDQAAALPGPIGNVAGALGGVSQSVGVFSKSLGSLRGVLMATGIGALAVVLGSLAAYFTDTTEGAKKFRVIMAGLSGVMEAISDVGKEIAQMLIGLFENPLGSIKQFAASLKQYILDQINLYLSGLGHLGESLTKLFAGDFKGAAKEAASGVKDMGEAVLRLNPMTGIVIALGEKVAEVGKNAIDTADALMLLEDRMNAVKDAERELTVDRARSNKTIAEARLIADDVTKSIDERIAAVKRAGAVEQQVADEEMRIARERLALANEDIIARGKDEKLLDTQAAARVRLFELERENIMRRKRLQGEEISLLREAEAQKKAIAEAEKARLKELRDAADARYKAESDRLQSHLTQLADLQVAAIDDEQTREEQAAILAFERKTALIVGQGEVETELRARLAEELGTTLTNINDKYEKAAELKRQADKKKELADAQEIAAARINLAQQVGNTTIGIARLVSKAMGDNAEVAKGIATAEVWINAAVATASAISKAVQSSATPYDMIANIAVAVGTVAGAIASTIEILNKADIPGGTNGPVGSMPSFTATAPTGTPVSTNVTGLVNTQQAELQPIQAFVVETQITGAQGNVEQIYGQASFGLGG